VAEEVRIEWPSGNITLLSNVATDTTGVATTTVSLEAGSRFFRVAKE